MEREKAIVTLTADLNDYGSEVRMAISDCIRSAVHEALYDVVKDFDL
jgi:hypothetical protein